MPSGYRRSGMVMRDRSFKMGCPLPSVNIATVRVGVRGQVQRYVAVSMSHVHSIGACIAVGWMYLSICALSGGVR